MPRLTKPPRAAKAFSPVIERVSRAVHWRVETHAARDVIAVAHGGTIQAQLALALGLDPEAALAFTIDNCSVARIDCIDGPDSGHGWSVVTVNRPPR
jgi:broad specificity phosphatase PhoE